MILKNVLFSANTDWFFLLHRVAIAKAFKKEGFRVIVAAKDTGKRNEIENLGFSFVNVNFDRKGLNPFFELVTLYNLFKLYKKNDIELAYQVTIKPIIYGSIVSRILEVKNINTICGLGHVYATDKLLMLRKMISYTYRFILNKKQTFTFFENKDDLKRFETLGILNAKSYVSVVNGTGVDLNKFFPTQKKTTSNKITITLASRMLWNKGIVEFVEAAKLLQHKYADKIEFKLYGIIDEGNRESITNTYLKSIAIDGYLKWYGFEADMVKVYSNSDIVTLPSYYGEGLPTVLAEACAMGLPIVTTDSVGCKECVDEGINGFKVPIKSAAALAVALEKLIIDKELRKIMGKASRIKAENKFDQKVIVNQYATILRTLLNE